MTCCNNYSNYNTNNSYVYSNKFVDKTFGKDNFCPKYKQKIGSTITYIGVYKDEIPNSLSITSVDYELYQKSGEVDTTEFVNINLLITSKNTLELKFDATDKDNLNIGDKYLIIVNTLLSNGDLFIRSFEISISDIKNRVPSITNYCGIPNYIDSDCNQEECCKIGSPIVYNSVGIFNLQNYPDGAKYAIITAMSPLEYEINLDSEVTTDGVADLSPLETLGVYCDVFPAINITGLNSTDVAQFTVQYWTCNPNDC